MSVGPDAAAAERRNHLHMRRAVFPLPRWKEEDMPIQPDAYAARKRLVLASTLGVVLLLAALPAVA